MPLVVLGLGSNLGDSVATIRAAFACLAELLENTRLSRLRGSKAMYVEDQPDFVNAAVAGITELAARDLLASIQGIEARFGRDRPRERFKGPRPLDIDILVYGELVLKDPELVIPHASLLERRFALEPLLELEPGLRDPRTGEPFSVALSRLPDRGIYLLG
jgi:2-amino-4-hydroxy-6-hydroxymethyldihydropteridine diphosphokinase